MTDTAEFEGISQQEIQAELRKTFRGAVKFALEAVLEEVVRERVGAGRWARAGTRKDQRNGTYLRQLLTAYGHIEVAVPRTRNRGSPVDVVGRYRRRSPELDGAIIAAYVHGVSMRDVAQVTEALAGAPVGRSSVSRVTKRLDEHVEALRTAPITGPVPYLYLDATFVDARWARRVENVSVLVAYGVGLDGKRTLLAITLGAQESEDSWADLLRQLLDRG
ncbi:MAG: IS256 family transposase, partial [Deltaproteobacteria bacterium]